MALVPGTTSSTWTSLASVVASGIRRILVLHHQWLPNDADNERELRLLPRRDPGILDQSIPEALSRLLYRLPVFLGTDSVASKRIHHPIE